MRDMSKGIVAINIQSGEKKEFMSMNEAARFLGINFQAVQIASVSGGVRVGWKIYPSADNIKRRIQKLQEMLRELEATEAWEEEMAMAE